MSGRRRVGSHARGSDFSPALALIPHLGDKSGCHVKKLHDRTSGWSGRCLHPPGGGAGTRVRGAVEPFQDKPPYPETAPWRRSAADARRHRCATQREGPLKTKYVNSPDYMHASVQDGQWSSASTARNPRRSQGQGTARGGSQEQELALHLGSQNPRRRVPPAPSVRGGRRVLWSGESARRRVRYTLGCCPSRAPGRPHPPPPPVLRRRAPAVGRDNSGHTLVASRAIEFEEPDAPRRVLSRFSHQRPARPSWRGAPAPPGTDVWDAVCRAGGRPTGAPSPRVGYASSGSHPQM
eukprot:gene23018-biopygen23790